jgi:signal transduction histidine kinase
MNEKEKRIAFHQRLFWTIFSIFLGFICCFLIFQYQREYEFSEEKLNILLSNYNHQLSKRITSLEDIDPEIDRFITEVSQPELRITIMTKTGDVLFDNSGTESLSNHQDRSEVQKALLKKDGYAIRRSGSTGKRYFYSASLIGNHIYRTALPFNNQLQQFLTVNLDFVYFMLFMIIVFFLVLSRFTYNIGKSIAKLRDFAQHVKEGEIPQIDDQFPDDELGDISQNIITLYSKQQEIKEEEVKRKRQLTQNVAHELKTPVSSIQGYLETILSNPELSKEKQQFFLERCYSQSSRLSNLIADISLLNQLDETTNMYEITVINIALLVEEIITECSKELTEKQIISHVTITENLTVQGNYSLLYSIFRNLLDNAISYAGENVTINIECYREDLVYYYFRFSDNGVGIAEDHLARIFERFYRIDKGRSRKSGGTGLGLSIVKNAILFHKGQISIESTPGKGTDFLFTLRKNI